MSNQSKGQCEECGGRGETPVTRLTWSDWSLGPLEITGTEPSVIRCGACAGTGEKRIPAVDREDPSED